MATNKLKIKLFGEAYKLKRIELAEELLQKMDETAYRMNQPLIEVLLDPFFYHYLKNNNIRSIDDIPGNTWEGLLNTPKNQIEIWFKNKKVKKLKLHELLNELLLFPLYNVNIQTTNPFIEKGIYVEQKEIGLIGTYEINLENFNIDELEFKLLQINELIIFEKFQYKHQLLYNTKKDTLITFQHCFEIQHITYSL